MRFHFSVNIDIDSQDICTRIKYIDLLFKFPREKLYEKYKNKYIIIPFGENCFPRTLTSINGIKPYKKDGELTCPFDQVCSSFTDNVDLFVNDFDNFFDNLELYKNEVTKNNYYKNIKYNISFIHEENLSLEEFKALYKKRIENFYSYLNAKDKYIFFVVFSWSYPKKEAVERLINKIKKYRKDFCIIILNTNPGRVKWKLEQVQVVNMGRNKSLKKMGSSWVPQLKGLTNLNARIVNNKYGSHLIEIINNEMRNYFETKSNIM